MQELIPSQVTDAMNNRLETIPTDVEIKQAVFGMGTYKSPGPDGMSSTFYKGYWPIIGPDVISEVQNFFTTGRLKQAYNHTFLALIPKCNNASKVEQFRPISLCNVFLKIITKILSSRIRPILEHLIHPSQAAFIPQRSINDNIIINHEVMHYMNGKKGSTGFMAIEIDLAKAYDRLNGTYCAKYSTSLVFVPSSLTWFLNAFPPPISLYY